MQIMNLIAYLQNSMPTSLNMLVMNEQQKDWSTCRYWKINWNITADTKEKIEYPCRHFFKSKDLTILFSKNTEGKRRHYDSLTFL